MHRLDRDTSGLLVVARSDDAHRRLQEALRRRGITREYLALVRGRPTSRRGRIEAAIGRDSARRDADVARHGHAARGGDGVRARGAAARRTRSSACRLETGRTHQIRVHLAAIDLPVSGDPTYGVAGDSALERQFLHAARLAFAHPVTARRIEVESPLPEDLETALATARG